MKDETTAQLAPHPLLNRWTRRRFITSTSVAALGLSAGLAATAPSAFGSHATPAGANAGLPIDLLNKSPFAYISPLHANGRESTCHAELWYGWLDDSIVVTVSSLGWKAKAMNRGLDRARIWVGDHGRWKRMFGRHNESFRDAAKVGAQFQAKVEAIDDPKMIDRLLALYTKKYPAEIEIWRERMKTGSADGSRRLLRYRLTRASQ